MNKKIETYVVLKSDKIIKVYRTSQGKSGVLKSLEFESINDFDEIKQMDNYTEAKPNLHRNELDNKGKLRPIVDRVKEGYRKLDPHLKIENDEIKEKSEEEKIANGLIEVPSDKEIIDGKVVAKKKEEPTQEEIREQLIQKKMRELAVKELEREGKI